MKESRKNEASVHELAELILDVVPEPMKTIRRHLRAAIQGEITHPQLRILAHVTKGTNTATGLAERQGVSTVAISKMVDGLVAKGLLERTYKEGNRKQVFLHLTAGGKRLYLRARKAAKIQIGKELTLSPKADQRAIKLGLQAIQKSLRGQDGAL